MRRLVVTVLCVLGIGLAFGRLSVGLAEDKLAASKPVETPKPSVSGNRCSGLRWASKAAEDSAPGETAKPVESPKPAEIAKPAEITKPTEATKPVETSKPAANTRPAAEASKSDGAKAESPAPKTLGAKPAVLPQVLAVGSWEAEGRFREDAGISIAVKAWISQPRRAAPEEPRYLIEGPGYIAGHSGRLVISEAAMRAGATQCQIRPGEMS